MSKTIQYPLASARRRIICRICDYLMLIAINIGLTISLTFFTMDSSFTQVASGQGWLFSLMLLVANLIFIGLWWLYFVQIVYWTNGYTLFAKIFHIRLYWKDKTNVLGRIFKHEVMIIGAICFSNLLMSAISFAFSDPLIFITNTFSMNSVKATTQGIQIASSILITLYVLSCFPALGVIVNTVTNSHSITYLDQANDLFMIHLVKNNNEKVDGRVKTKNVLPGEIDIDELEQIS